MRCVLGKAAAFLTLGPVITHCLPTHIPTTSIVLPEEGSELWWRDSDGVIVQFQASCAGCDNTSYWVPIELRTKSRNGVCENVTISVNGRVLDHHWNGTLASGSGTIHASSSHDEDTELSANWNSKCVAAASAGQDAHVLTLVLNNATTRSNDAEDRIGFTVSFTFIEQIQILRVSNFPVQLTDDQDWGTWGRLEDAATFKTEQGSHPEQTKPNPNALDAEIETELQKLQLLRYKFEETRHLMNLQEDKIRGLLAQDCESLFAKWKQCDDLVCYLKTSWQSVPEIYRSIKYRFGSLESQKLLPICRAPSNRPSKDEDVHAPSATTTQYLPLITTLSSEQTGVPLIPSMTPGPLNPPAITDAPSSITGKTPPEVSEKQRDNPIFDIEIPSIESPTKAFLRSCVILLLICLVVGLVFRTIRRSTAFRRRRRDLASRREEQQARRAYRNAARRLRWRQWWEGGGGSSSRSASQARSTTSSHSLPELDRNPHDNIQNHPRIPSHGEEDSDDDFLPQEEGGMMQAEILGLRRVLEYVGELVGNSDSGSSSFARRSTRSRSRSRPPRYEDIHNHNHSNYPSAIPPGTSMGIGSPRASTMFSLETGSLVTLETLDTMDSETAPPSYHA